MNTITRVPPRYAYQRSGFGRAGPGRLAGPPGSPCVGSNSQVRQTPGAKAATQPAGRIITKAPPSTLNAAASTTFAESSCRTTRQRFIWAAGEKAKRATRQCAMQRPGRR
jgi:hypothetical protein